MENKYIEMKQKDIKILKEKLWLLNDKKCPVLGKKIPLEKMVLDHAHKRKDEDYAANKGVIREALDFRINAILGKLENSIKRVGLDKDPDFDLPTMLRNAADYFEKGPYKDENGYMYIHPKEVKQEPKFKKSSYNKLKKVYDGKAKFPDYPKSQKLTKKLKELFKKYNIEVEFYK